jgi:hypothetical protein
MKLSEQEKKEMLEDGLSLARRDHFRAAGESKAGSLEEYLAALDDLQSVRPPPKPGFPIEYTNIRL